MSDGERLSTRQQVWDLALGLVCLAVAVVVHLSGTEAVSRNLDPSAFSVLLTCVAVGPLVVRRRYPLTVLAVTLLGLIGLIATQNTVGASTLGCIVAFYTAIAGGSRREMQIALVVMTVGVAAGLALRPVDLSAGGAVVNLVIFVGAGALGAGARQRRERFEAEVVVARERAARSASEERLRITRELHDIIGHAMGVMVVQAGVAERLLDTDPARTRAALASISETGRSSLAEMRQVLGALRDGDGTADSLPRDPSPTLARLPDLVDQVRGAGLPVSLSVQGGTAPLSPGLELAAYRVVQEALTNSLKHSGASQAWVSVDRAADLLHVVVRRRRARDAVTDPARPGARGDAGAGRGLRRRPVDRASRRRGLPRGRPLPAGVDVIRVVVADDQELVRTGFALILGSDPGIEVVGEAANGAEAVAAARELVPDVVLMDIRMPVMDGIEATRHITDAPETGGVRVLVVTTFDGDEYVVDALRAGASGFLLKDTAPADLIQGVEVVAAGDALLAPAVTLRMIDRFVRVEPPGRQGHDALVLPPLTQRESEVLVAVAEGLSNPEIAARLFVSYSTVKTHVSHLLTKLDARDRAQLVMLAHRAGVTS